MAWVTPLARNVISLLINGKDSSSWQCRLSYLAPILEKAHSVWVVPFLTCLLNRKQVLGPRLRIWFAAFTKKWFVILSNCSKSLSGSIFPIPVLRKSLWAASSFSPPVRCQTLASQGWSKTLQFALWKKELEWPQPGPGSLGPAGEKQCVWVYNAGMQGEVCAYVHSRALEFHD